MPRSSQDAGNPDAPAAFPRAAGPTIAFVLFLAAALSVVLSFTQKFCHRAIYEFDRVSFRDTIKQFFVGQSQTFVMGLEANGPDLDMTRLTPGRFAHRTNEFQSRIEIHHTKVLLSVNK
ncbi:MAG TPA: hypothetical protein VI320_02745 [Terracidiphilus sp.]|jgi:hypothetical protein